MVVIVATIFRANPAPFPFWTETFSIFLGDVFATIFLGASAYFLWFLLKYPGFRVGANWTYVGWDVGKMKRLPNASDTTPLVLMPNISVVSRDMAVKKIIATVWVRQRADVHDPGTIHGALHLHNTGVPAEVRTTGGDPLNLTGPRITCQGSNFMEIFNCPIFVQTTDGEFFQAESPGNPAKGIVKLRYKVQGAFDSIRRRLLNKLR